MRLLFLLGWKLRMQEEEMFNQNQELVDANTLDGKAATSQSTSFKNKQPALTNIAVISLTYISFKSNISNLRT